MRRPDLVEALDNFLKNNAEGRKALVITHWGGDADSIGASHVLARMLEKHYGASKVYFTIPETPTAHSKAILQKLGMNIDEDVGEVDLAVLVDVGSLEQLGSYLDYVLGLGCERIIIDHHLHKTHHEGFRYFASDEYQSTSEIVYDLASFAGWRLSKDEAEALFMGIYYDTARLSVADRESMSKLCGLASLGLAPSELLVNLETAMDESERIARLKAARRMALYRAGEWIVAASSVSAFQTSAARSILSLGAHIAVVAGEDDDGMVSIALRAQPEFVKKTSINMGRTLVDEIIARYGGAGGGHATVARVKCRGEVEDVLSFVVKRLGQLLGLEVRQVS